MAATETLLLARDYDLANTLGSGQVFRWWQNGGAWDGVVGRHLVRLTQMENGLRASTAQPVKDWSFLREFLQTETDLAGILKSFPDDEPMRRAVAACRGLRLLRQEPWECLASFILSSTKQIVQIRQIIALLCERFGEPIIGPDKAGFPASQFGRPIRRPLALRTGTFVEPAGRNDCPIRDVDTPSSAMRDVDVTSPVMGQGVAATHCFPTPPRLASASEAELRDCKMGFRAPALLHTARLIADGKFDLDKIRALDYAAARTALMQLRGVGGKIADCVLLFAYGFDSAFPVDVWVERALQELYFPRRRAADKRLRRFAVTHFGPHAGYAQQYLFHYMRTKQKGAGHKFVSPLS